MQKHCLLPTELGNLASINEDAPYSAVSPMEMDKIVLKRPFGGNAILWHKCFYQSVSAIQTASDRMSAIRITTDLETILIISVYMPVDYGNEQSVEDYITEIDLLGGLLESNEYDNVMILGDLNTDLRKGTSRSSRLLATFMSEFNLTAIGVDDIEANTKNTWHSSDFQTQSWIDYIIVSDGLTKTIIEFEIREDGGYLSDHWPIVLSTSVEVDGKISIPKNKSVGTKLL